jgi:TRAP-type C4-dicarboxylate transport system permease large subunit
MDTSVATFLLVPIFLPMVKSLGIDPVHFGILFSTIVTMGVMTPPVGNCLYIVCGVMDCPVSDYFIESLPFLFAICLEVAILVFMPDLVLFVPNLIFGAP